MSSEDLATADDSVGTSLNLQACAGVCCSGPNGALGLTQRPLSASVLGFIFRILKGTPKKELLWGLWVGLTS